MPEINSTSFGSIIGFLLPGFLGLFSLTYWFESTRTVFNTFLTADANFGLFFLILLGSLALGLVVQVVRWLVYECVLSRFIGPPLTPEERERLMSPKRLPNFRAAVDETYRFHQFYGGVTVTAPALLIGWLRAVDVSPAIDVVLGVAIVGIEVLLILGAMDSRRRYLQFSRAIAESEATT